MASQEQLLLEFNLSDLDRRYENDELISKIYCDVIGKVDEKDIVGVQILPKKWPRKVQLLCAHLPAKECLLIRGLEIGGGHIELHEPRQGVVKLSIENIPLDVPNEIVKSWAAQYGTVIDFRNEHHYINGKRVSWRSGTRYAYIINMTGPVPPTVKMNFNGVEFTVSVWHYGQTHRYCRWCKSTVEKSHECGSRPKRRCHNCGSETHVKADCPNDKLCFKCNQSGHVARYCPDSTTQQSMPTQPVSPSKSPMSVLPSAPTDATLDNDDLQSISVTSDSNPNDLTVQHESREASPPDSGDAHGNGGNKAVLNAVMIGTSNCRNLSLQGDDQLCLNMELLPQGGLSIEDAHEKLEEVSTDFQKKCDVVVIHVGSCDFPVRNTREMEENYTNYVELLNSISNACPQANILLSSVLPCSGEGKNRVNSQFRSFNQRLNELSQAEQQINYIENDMHFTDESGVISALFSSKDVTGIHLNEDGKMRLASNIQDALKGICYKRKIQTEWHLM